MPLTWSSLAVGTRISMLVWRSIHQKGAEPAENSVDLPLEVCNAEVARMALMVSATKRRLNCFLLSQWRYLFQLLWKLGGLCAYISEMNSSARFPLVQVGGSCFRVSGEVG